MNNQKDTQLYRAEDVESHEKVGLWLRILALIRFTDLDVEPSLRRFLGELSFGIP